MTVREIRLYGDPVLRTMSAQVTDFGSRTVEVARDLMDTVDHPGRAGVAAPQIGVPVRAFAYAVDDRRGVVFNPEIVALEGEQEGDEGCLSVPGLWFPTRRAAYARVDGRDPSGQPLSVEGEGELARCLQHEVDHLNGIVYLQRLEPPVRKEAMRAVRATAWFGN